MQSAIMLFASKCQEVLAFGQRQFQMDFGFFVVKTDTFSNQKDSALDCKMQMEEAG